MKRPFCAIRCSSELPAHALSCRAPHASGSSPRRSRGHARPNSATGVRCCWARVVSLTARLLGAYWNQLRCYELRGALSCGSPMPRGERIAKPAEWETPIQPVFFLAAGSAVEDRINANAGRSTTSPRSASSTAQWTSRPAATFSSIPRGTSVLCPTSARVQTRIARVEWWSGGVKGR